MYFVGKSNRFVYGLNVDCKSEIIVRVWGLSNLKGGIAGVWGKIRSSVMTC